MSAYIQSVFVAVTLLFFVSDVAAYRAKVSSFNVTGAFRHRSKAQTLTPQQKSVIVDRHNTLRAREGADNMESMTWNDFLATTAAGWAAVCKWKHGQADLGANPEYITMGQNLYATTGSTLYVEHAIDRWYYEKADYTYDTMQCVEGKMCGHYTQVVWANSREIGCAYRICEPLEGSGYSRGLYFVCNYGPAGNFNGQKPYTKGPACTKCRSGAGWCKNKLCCSAAGQGCSCAAICHNCAKLNDTTCRCSCAEGWHGTDCSTRCEDTNAHCNVNPGWPPYWCNEDRPYVKQGCPAMCHLCVPDRNATRGLCEPVGVNKSSVDDLSLQESEEPNNAQTLTPLQKSEIVDYHNILRAREGAANMELMTWNDFLATTAARWAAVCKWKHGQADLGANPEYITMGQNLYATNDSKLSIKHAIDSWYNEKADYTYNTMQCAEGKMCGHYTQVVWATSQEIGCAYRICESLEESDNSLGLYLVCNYGPAGNVYGLKPFTKGPVCTKCRSGAGWCKNELCCAAAGEDCLCTVSCQNSARLNQTTCRCSCAEGWHGADCSSRCENTNDNCNSNPGWPPSWCDHADKPYVKEGCPAMCKLCTPDRNTTAGLRELVGINRSSVDDLVLQESEEANLTEMLTTQQKSEIVDYHNILRAHEGAANMELMTWNDFLAATAARWSERCKWGHGQTDLGANPEYITMGQNLYATNGSKLSIKHAIDSWYNEKADYTFDKMQCVEGKMCGHYTQVVWATSREIGCSYHICKHLEGLNYSSGLFLVCNYGPAGNVYGQNPFTKGPACTKCGNGTGWCKNDLCCSTAVQGCSCAVSCQNCATLNETTCRCSCAEGWHGPDCSIRCEDTNDHCNKNPGWPPSWCHHVDKPFVKESCPAMCKLCIPNRNATPGLCELSSVDDLTLQESEEPKHAHTLMPLEKSEFVGNQNILTVPEGADNIAPEESEVINHTHALTTQQKSEFVGNQNISTVREGADNIAPEEPEVTNHAQTLTPEQKSEIVNCHNILRAREGAANMELMTWNDFLAITAARWAAVCTWEHGQTDLGANPEYKTVGQNLYATTSSRLSIKHAIYTWYNEKAYYTDDTMQCVEGKMCGHYTQMVWATSREIGCAYHICEPLEGSGYSRGLFLVCNYGPAGNVYGQKPFTKGPACTKCGSGEGWCKSKLCCSAVGKGCLCAATCYNCAALDMNTCQCSCAKGWHGPDCTIRCDDTYANCNSNRGWPPAWCDHADKPFVKEGCPAMCKLCTPDRNATPGLCEPVGINRSSVYHLAPHQRSKIVNYHNILRAREGADNMELVTWNDVLAKTAAGWAKVCKWEHGQLDLGANPEYSKMGQNLYATTGSKLSIEHAIDIWYNEKAYYTDDTMQCVEGKMCGHYTQVVWATSREIGCAYHICEPLEGSGYSRGLFLVCNYGPAGNVYGQKPYMKGQACTKCGSGEGWCKNKLCCSAAGQGCSCAAICHNCAKLNETTCRCSCAKGWHGPDCSTRCEDTNANCNSYPGWPPSWCHHVDKAYVREGCPAMCKLCTPDKNAKPGLCEPVNISKLAKERAEMINRALQTVSANTQLTFSIVIIAFFISNCNVMLPR